MKIGFIGLGNMGLPMAENILKKGFSLCVYNRTKEKVASLVNKGAHLAENPRDVANQCDIVITMVSNDAALKEVVEGEAGILATTNTSLIHVSMSTVAPDLSTYLYDKHREKGISFLAAPVSGRPVRAKEGALWIFLAGDVQSKEKALPVLNTMSCKVFDLGKDPAQASLFKLCNNFMILSLVESLSEALTTLEKGGISPEIATKVWGESILDCPVYHSYTELMCKRNFADGGFALNLGLKDIRHLQVYADKNLIPMPFLGELHEKLLISMGLGRQEHDWSGIALLTRELAGLK